MSTTNADAVSIVVTLLGFGLAIYGIVSEPLVVDSTRPTQTGKGEKVKAEIPAYARLWDDPFVVYKQTDKVKPPSPPLSQLGSRTLFLLVPTKTQQYEEDKENRIRIRYAIERALFDRGYAAAEGNLLSTIDIGQFLDRTNPLTPHSVPIQIFKLRPITDRTSNTAGRKPFQNVAVIWLPDAHFWQTDPLEAVWSTKLSVLNKTRTELNEANHDLQQITAAVSSLEKESRWVLLGPSDSDSLAYFDRIRLSTPSPWPTPAPSSIQVNITKDGGATATPSPDPSPPEPSSPLWVMPFRATVSESLLGLTVRGYRPMNVTGSASESPLLSAAGSQAASKQDTSHESGHCDVKRIRLPNRDDVLCAALVREIAETGTLPPHGASINVTVFVEWDTLYGRALAETFRALAAPEEVSPPGEKDYWGCLNKNIRQELDSLGYRDLLPPLHKPIKVTLVPYLRGLDGASTLYRNDYVFEAAKIADKQNEAQSQKTRDSIEPAEGTTQFDYIRRLISSMYLQKVPFWPELQRPDAIVIFGTDVYDKLALLKFLRQALKNCAYYTTDLDALYWHPHYLQYTKDLIVASSFPLGMPLPGEKDCRDLSAPVEFRDSYQSAAYWTVTRCLSEADDLTNDCPSRADGPLVYRIGNTKALPIYNIGTVQTPPTETRDSGVINELGGFLKSVTEPIIQGASPFWSVCLQLSVVALGLYALFVDIPRRMLLRREVSDELWNSALGFVPFKLRSDIKKSREAIADRWKQLPLRRKPWNRKTALIVESPPVEPKELKDPASRVNRLIKYYVDLVGQTVCQLELIEVALSYLSDLFKLRALKEPKSAETAKPNKLASDLQPFANYVRRDLTKPPVGAEESLKVDEPPYRALVRTILTFLDRRFPNGEFILVGLVGFLMVLAISVQPVPFLVGPETHSLVARVLRWIVEAVALLVTFFLFHRVCYEQYRFRKLVGDLQALVSENTGLSNRQLILLIAEASEPVANLAFLPCTLISLIFLSHLRPLGGVPFTPEMSLLLLLGLGVLTYSYAKLRAAALHARAAVRSDYQAQQVKAARLEARLKSYLKNVGPLQDDKQSLIVELNELLTKNSRFLRDEGVRPPEERSLRKPRYRQRLCDYLEQVIKRNNEIIDQISEVRSGMLAPIALNPIIGALMIPVGGAGGLSLIQWLITQAR